MSLERLWSYSKGEKAPARGDLRQHSDGAELSQRNALQKQQGRIGLTYRMIVVEKDPFVRELLELDLVRFGYEVFTCTDFDSVPVQVQGHPSRPEKSLSFDFLLADVGDRGYQNLDCTSALIQGGYEVSRIAVMAASLTNRQQEKLERLGCRIFAKPFALSELRDWLDQGRIQIPTDRKLAPWLAAKVSRHR